MKRRRFVFWLGLGLFGLAEKLRADSLDSLAAAIMRSTEPAAGSTATATPEHWTAASNRTWRWFEREHFVAGQWKLTGITTPIHKRTGEPYTLKTGYLDESLVPSELRDAQHASQASGADAEIEFAGTDDPGHADPARRARHGRPPSRWLRSLHADEIRIWLRTIDVPEAGVEGMTFFTHLTRDHSFAAANVASLSIDDQAKLHAAAHYGY